MSNTLEHVLSAGVDALGLKLPPHVIQQQLNFIGLLQQWNASYNLTAVRDINEMVSKHLLDSLSVLPYLGEGDVIDVGAGAGLPGIPLALARPEQAFTLIDTVGKKTRFMTQAKIKLGLGNVTVVNARVEDHRREGGYDVVISRAYASTDDFIASTRHLHHAGTRVLVMQGKLEENFDDSHHVLQQTREIRVPGLDAERHLLEIVLR